MLQRFSIASMLYCAFVLSFFGSLVLDRGIDFRTASLWIPLLLVVHPIAQLIYLFHTRPMLALREWKETDSLDDFMTNQQPDDEHIVEPTALMKMLAVVGVGGAGFMLMTVAGRFHRLFSDMLQGPLDFVINFSALVCLPTGLLTIIYNVRTFSMKRLKKV